MTSTIEAQIYSIQRNNLYLLCCPKKQLGAMIMEIKQANIPILDMGKELSLKLQTCIHAKYLALEMQEYIPKMIETEAKAIFQEKPPIIALHNLGILLEPALALEANALLKNIAKSIAIILIWENEKDNKGNLYWQGYSNSPHFHFSSIDIKPIYT